MDDQISEIQINDEVQENSQLLVAGEVVFHEKFKQNSFVGEGDHQIRIQFKNPIQLTDLLIYGSVDSEYKPHIMSVKLDSERGLKEIDWDMETIPGEALILSFDAIETNEVVIEIMNEIEFRLSEISFLGTVLE